MITSGVYLFKSEKEATPLAEKIEQETKKIETELAKRRKCLLLRYSLSRGEITASPVAAVQQSVMQATYKATVKVAENEPAVISSDDDMEENAEVITLPDNTAVVETEEVAQDYPEVEFC